MKSNLICFKKICTPCSKLTWWTFGYFYAANFCVISQYSTINRSKQCISCFLSALDNLQDWANIEFGG
jgi:hypothetical protein